MEIKRKNVPIRDLIVGYVDLGNEGVEGWKGKLDIRPPYQREFVYNDKQREAVIDTVTKGFPLNVMYWAVRDNGDFEIIDGQQRTISICQFINSDFSYKDRYFHNLSDDEQEKILNYELTIYECSGTDSEKLEWFKTINIAGEELTDQELRNAVYHGSWVTDAKRYFSKNSCPAYQIGGRYLNGSAIRQDYLETVIKWISGNQIEDYMGKNQHKENAQDLWVYFTNIIEWVESVFSKYRKEMKGLSWGEFYNKYKSIGFNSEEIEERVSNLYEDLEIKNNKGIYQYILTGDSKYLNLRTFEDHVKKSIYEKQKNKCAHCKKEFPFNQMHADHIKPWSLGGKTEPNNCQILCQSCNAKKSDNY
ncbi:DUF262 domain-containing protein (plasmid) [Enterococcus hirae]|uniref:GmrSD restriction endonuclease domain-containing protein n=1 Tax=Enterococcus hirae TaxID=1354 RepID=UPI0020194180|nr:DUF262 domain-containing protein [Enterococcus hirae]MCL4598624.1 DUF262 domain-containing protein [Enterococcus hirae]UQR37866.1 DUF262 domain-containing protein [Enterococcus hirae]